MQVDIAVPGTFHAFKLGRQLESRNSLRRIYTTYPKFATDTEGIPDEKVTHIRYPELIAQVGNRFQAVNKIIPSQWNEPLSRWKGMAFDKSVARKLEPAEDGIFLGFAGVSLESLQRANELGFTTVVERSSSHIRTQKEILDEEYLKYEQRESSISQQHIKREEKEYDTADYVVMPSKFVQESFVEQGFNEEKVKCVPFGVNPPEVQQVSDDTTYFIYSGSVTLRKGIQYLLPAWDSLDLTDVELIVTSNIDESVKPIVQDYKDDDSIQFLGWVDDLYEWFGKSSAFVFPTLEEGSAMVVYEAMASGLPIITTFNSGWVGKDGKHGIEVPTRDSESVAEAIQYMYNNPEERKQMGENARDHITSNFTEDDYGERIFSEYQAMINQ
ncbi:glycosyltransferase family 4 protein [Halorubrum sp. GN11GM_10-3_MGM]|uniref:glycosyltransferase family 4 protein n=1 Tax=Halorubrum sp. GN11GM_10-3_MGM TaxID=2518111 RepID=UPI0010F84D4C|nr:glycosyltransferase family 4 protein [Halorubrum sp. GN11GM_10-3_MGM]TKX71837.1 glycosyltransferase [Halorubrum sp. GN11GM_10-3_MGM]